jgi:predicted transcriptional regulator
VSTSEVKAIKVSKETYAKLSEIAGELQVKLRRPVSIEEAMKDLIKRREKGRKISDLAGSWNVTDAEFKEIKASIDESWKKWKPTER